MSPPPSLSCAPCKYRFDRRAIFLLWYYHTELATGPVTWLRSFFFSLQVFCSIGILTQAHDCTFIFPTSPSSVSHLGERWTSAMTYRLSAWVRGRRSYFLERVFVSIHSVFSRVWPTPIMHAERMTHSKTGAMTSILQECTIEASN